MAIRALRQRSCYQPLYFADDSLYDRLPIYEEIMAALGLKKGGRAGWVKAHNRTFGGDWYSDDAINHVFLCDGYGATRMRQNCDLNAQYAWWNSSRTH